MANSLSSLTAGVGGVQISSVDTSGSLDIKSGTTTIVSITSAGAAVTGTLSSTSGALNGTLGATTPSTGVFTDVNTPNTFGFKNRIINGGMVIDQRNAGASGTAIGYTVDRFQYSASQASKLTWQQNAGSVTPPTGFVTYLGGTSSSAYSIGASDYFVFSQHIEGFNTADLGWGTANAATVTLSFWVRSSLTGTFGGALKNSAGNRSYPFTYSIPAANTWTSVSVTIAGETTGTWLTTNGVGLTVLFGLGVGSTYSGTAGSWQAANYLSATGATSVVGTSGATFYITGVQLEKGSTATSFDYRPYGTELSLCQRYLPAFNGSGEVCNGGSFSATQSWFHFPFQVQPRVAPTGITATYGSAPNTFYVYTGTQSSAPITAMTYGGASLTGGRLYTVTTSVLTAGQYTPLASNAATNQILWTGCEL
jgi:hypothetical protein